jgi:hypothetical protein
MLFVLVMECFHALIRKDDSLGLLQQLGRHDIRFRASLYADHVVAFFSPVELDLRIVKRVLALFEGASGLAANLSKSHVYPINCSDEQISLVRSSSIAEFPCTYLGVPLSIKRIPKAALQPLVDKVARRLPLARETTQSWWSLGPSQIHPLGYLGAYLYGDFHCTLGYQRSQDAHPGLPLVRHRSG